MEQILDFDQISFDQLEACAFNLLRHAFCEVLKGVLEHMDATLLASRDSARYQPKDIRSRKLESLLGEIEIRRRYYWDREKQEHVALLDSMLGLGKRERVSKGLAVLAAVQAVIGPSYRGASEALSSLFGFKPVSHESIRQLMLRLGEAAEQERSQERNRCDGKKKVELLLVEADGYWVSMQQQKKDRREARLMLAHEGWQPRTPGSSEYELVGRTHHFEITSGDFWYEASLHLYSRYDIDENTLVVINGDRAPWIRKAVEYFPNAIYQVDRFHVKRDVRRLLSGSSEMSEALEAFDRNQPEQFRAVLSRAASKQSDAKRKAAILELCREVERIPEAFRDYRTRLEEAGYDTTGLRGLGAIESNVDLFSNRTKKRGQSWKPKGLRAILHGLVKRFEDRLAEFAKHVSRLSNMMDEEQIKAKISEVKRQVVANVTGIRQTNTPVKDAGRIRSGGMSRLIRSLDDATAPTI